MVAVDARNPFLRDYFPRWLAAHTANLEALASRLPRYAAESARAEEEEAAGRPPRPLAAVFDIDEVLLCNLHRSGDAAADWFVADFFGDPPDAPHPRGSPRDPPYPGARRLLESARAAGLELFFVTGRAEGLRADTVADFAAAGFPAAGGDRLRLRPPAGAGGKSAPVRRWKLAERESIAASHRIVVNVGDQLSDLGGPGDRHVLLPHPFYTTP